jgi:hypothetical protein
VQIRQRDERDNAPDDCLPIHDSRIGADLPVHPQEQKEKVVWPIGTPRVTLPRAAPKKIASGRLAIAKQPEDDHQGPTEAAEWGSAEQRKGEIKRASTRQQPN